MSAAIDDAAAGIAAQLVGGALVRTERGDHGWIFHFTHEAWVRVECPWRILFDHRIALGGGDHAQKFGRPEPLDASRESERLLRDKTIQVIRIRADTADLAIEFDDHTILEVLNTSCGYEGWEFGGRGLNVIAMGGGELTSFGG
jgi:hypothetical protein